MCIDVKTWIDLYCCEVYFIRDSCIHKTAKYHNIISRSVSGHNTITYYSDID